MKLGSFGRQALVDGLGAVFAGLDLAARPDFNTIAEVRPYQKKLLYRLQIAEPDRRTKGRRGAAKRLADRKAWNAGKR
jgi:hypothetical protein